ncbi:hypothetical protein RUM43_005727 [Polyplax serrata]|uniref:Uncharacterized protein n=1 Tax=Polyplax serrata TaxID=468196 RepID=A0AAN8NX89_POLSC
MRKFGCLYLKERIKELAERLEVDMKVSNFIKGPTITVSLVSKKIGKKKNKKAERKVKQEDREDVRDPLQR